MSVSSRKNEVDIHSYSSMPSFLHGITQPQIEGSDSSDHDHNNLIDYLDIAEGLKNMLVSHGFNLESLLIMRSHDLAEILGIDEYVAKIIISAAHDIKKKG